MTDATRMIIFIALFAWVNPIQATTYTFTTSGAWGNAANWDANGVPPTTLTSGDEIIIDCAYNTPCQLSATQTIGVGASLTLMSGNLYLMPGSPFTFFNYGTITVNSGMFWIVPTGSGHTVSNFGNINLNGGSLQIMNNTLVIHPNAPPELPAELNIGNGSELRIEGGILKLNGKMTVTAGMIINIGGGTIQGEGEWTNLGNYGCGGGSMIDIGTTYGKMTFINSMGQCTDDKMRFNLSGTEQGINYDWLAVNGHFYPNSSALIVTLDGGYTPIIGQTFDIITASNITGTFDLGISSIGMFSISYLPGVVRLTYSGVLPIELTQFDVNTEGAKNILNWRTISETNNRYFDIERSTDGITFHNIGQVKGNNKPSNYQFVDNTPLAKSYYRLRQIDFDGKETLSKIVYVEQKGKINGLKVYPTLVSNGFLTVDTEGGDFSIYNIVGQQVQSGKTAQRLDVSALAKGTYILKVGTAQAKFVKQ